MMSEVFGLKQPIDFQKREKNKKRFEMKLSMENKLKGVFGKTKTLNKISIPNSNSKDLAVTIDSNPADSTFISKGVISGPSTNLSPVISSPQTEVDVMLSKTSIANTFV
jgi:hypothetical protein